MGASLLQLISTGEQDIHLIGNPQMTFFKTVIKRHTHFSMESLPNNFNEFPDFGKKVSCLIDRKGDLLTNLLLEIKLPSLPTNISWTNGIGLVMLKKIELVIGGEIIDTINGEWLNIDSELTIDESKKNGFYEMIGKYNIYNRNIQDNKELTLYIPLKFWFTKNIGNSLPLIAMQYSNIVVNCYFRDFNECYFSGTDSTQIPDRLKITNACLFSDVIYLDENERRKFAISSHTYIIEQLQLCDGNGVSSNDPSSKVYLDFNLPVKEIFWVYQADDVSIANDWLNYSSTLINDLDPQPNIEPITNVELRINGQERFTSRDGSYFRLVEPFYRHTRVSNKYIYTYSFALKPELYQPSGHLNFSWVDNAEFLFRHPTTILKGKINVYALNYNFIHIKKGMVALRYNS